MELFLKSKYLNHIFNKKVWIYENIKMVNIMKKYYVQNKRYQVTHDFFKGIVEGKHFEIFQKHINELNEALLYQSKVHGYKHIVNVCLLAYLIACNVNLSTDDINILLEIALYHDIGRINDKEDREHGQRGAKKFTEQVSKNKNNKMIPAVIQAHSLLDDEAKSVFNKYGLEKSQYRKYQELLMIIKDADALDRFRLRIDSLNTKYLRIEYSKELVSLACVLSEVD